MRILKRGRKKRIGWVVGVFAKVPDVISSATSDYDEPLIGVVDSESEAREVATKYSQIEIRWEKLRLYSEGETPVKQ